MKLLFFSSLPALLLSTLMIGGTPLVIVGVPQLSHAQESPADSGEDSADRLLEQGITQMEASDFEAAQESLQQALELYQAEGDRAGEGQVFTALGHVYLGQEAYDLALEYQQRALAIAHEIQDPALEARVLNNLGLAYRETGELELELQTFERAFSTASDVEGFKSLPVIFNNWMQALRRQYNYIQILDTAQETTQLAITLGDRQLESYTVLWQAYAYIYIGHLERANQLFQQGLQIAESIEDSDLIERAQALLDDFSRMNNPQFAINRLNQYAGQYREKNRFQEAVELFQYALRLSRETDNPMAESIVLAELGYIYNGLGEYQQSIEVLRESLAIQEELERPFVMGRTLNLLGLVYQNLSQHEEAIPLLEQALEIAQEVEDRDGEGNALLNLGNAYLFLGQYQASIEFYEQALAIKENIGNRDDIGTLLNNLGNVYRSIGRYEQAIQMQEQALKIAQDVGSRDGEGSALSNLGSIYLTLGQYQRSLEFYEQALAIQEDIGARNDIGTSLNNLGNVYRSMGEYERAIQVLEQAIEIAQEMGDKGVESTALLNLGGTHYFLENYQRSIDFTEQALNIFQDLGERDGQARALSNIGYIYRELEEYEDSFFYFQAALNLFQELESPLEIGEVLSNLGGLLSRQDRSELAIVFYKESVNIRESIRSEIQGLPLEQQQSLADTFAEDYRSLADLLLQEGRVLEAQQVLDLLKVQELDAYLNNVRGNATTAGGVAFWQPEQEILERFNAQHQQAISLGKELTALRQIPEGDRTPTQQQRISELVSLEEALNRQFNDFLESDEILELVSQLSITTQRQTLNLDDVARLRDDLRDLNAVLLYPLILDDRLELVITTPDAPPLRRTVEVSREDLNQAILNFRQALEDPRSDAIAPAHQLYQWLIEPLEADLDSADLDTIIYAPDGALRYIPLGALHDGDRYLVERYAINNITARSLTDLNAQPATSPRVLAGAFADQSQVYPVQIGQRSVDFRGLPFAGLEVETLVATVPNITSFMDADFSLEAVRSRLNEYDIIHFATHAAFVPGLPEDSFILFGNGDRPTLADIRDWSLQNVDLVVLSACETGLGGFGNGEEILGLGYQFQRAGARATLASLWQVNDQGTQELINAFYTALNNGYSKAESLRRSQIALITSDETVLAGERGADVEITDTRTGRPLSQSADLSHPYYWAPFILIGNGL